MKNIATMLIICIALCVCLCGLSSCSKQSEGGGSGTTIPQNTDNYWRDEAAKISGQRIKQVIEEQKASESAGNSVKETADPNATDDPNKMEGITETKEPRNTNEPEPTAQMLVNGDYAEALSDDELEAAIRIAKDYASDEYSAMSNNFRVADDSNELYSQFPIYNRGNLIVIDCDTPTGKTHSVAVGRINVNAEWKVIGAK